METAAVPNQIKVEQMESTGSCIVNVDGQCMAGGELQAGDRGYTLASLGYPATKCAAFGLFCAGNQPYASASGWSCSTNFKALSTKGV